MKGAQESAVHLKSVAVISRTLPFFVVACLSLLHFQISIS